jgi:3-deoxy-D-manno-octulosonate 8-phosphate phosphatase (KDO 8-P phosphatase)
MGDIAIIAIEYLEPYFEQTRECIKATGLPVYYIARNPKGVGSLAEAINRGVAEHKDKYDLLWIVTNITFNPDVPKILASHIGDAAIIHPSFKSDHGFMFGGHGVKKVPFVEFTAPMIRTNKWAALDESMPYWGHDVDHGLRVKSCLVDYGCSVDHVYIRNAQPHPVTQRRLAIRRSYDMSTKKHLLAKHGANWKEKAAFKSSITGLYKELLSSKCTRLIIDCDGVLTNGRVQYSETGERYKEFHSRDMTAIRSFIASGYTVEIRTTSSWSGLKRFADKIGATLVRQDVKTPDSEAFIYIGDDVPDIEMMKAAVSAYCPSDANSAVVKYCKPLKTRGGEGVISELYNVLNGKA